MLMTDVVVQINFRQGQPADLKTCRYHIRLPIIGWAQLRAYTSLDGHKPGTCLHSHWMVRLSVWNITLSSKMAQAVPQTKEDTMDKLRASVLSMYPGLQTSTYCVPPCIMNRVPWVREYIAGVPAQVHNPLGTSKSTKPKPESTDPSVKRPRSPETSNPSKKLAKDEQRPVHLAESVTSESNIQQEQGGENPEPSTSTFPSVWSDDPNPHSSPVPVQKSDFQSDFAQQHVLHCLKELGKASGGAMFIISDLQVPEYLAKLVDILAAHFNLAQDMRDKHDRYGDFDILIVHRHYGVLIGEMKSQGLKIDLQKGSDWKLAAACCQKHVFQKDVPIDKAVSQLEKLERVMRYILHDICPTLRIRKSLILPYVKREQLQRMFEEKKSRLREGIVDRQVDAQTAAESCLTADDLSDINTPWEVPDTVLGKLKAWFTRCMSSTADPSMTEAVYIDILARVVGPATSVRVHCVSRPRVSMEVRTPGEGVSHTGEVISQLVLTPEQFDLLTLRPRLVCLVGPPGTGKTIVLVLIGVRWIVEGHHVCILCLNGWNLAISKLIKLQIEKTVQQYHPNRTTGEVHLITLNLYDGNGEVSKGVNLIEKHSDGQPAHVLMDEVHFNSKKDYSDRCHRLVSELSRKLEDLHLWAATAHQYNIPEIFQTHKLTIPLRSPPAVTREVEPSLQSWSIPPYTGSGVPPATDGPDVIRLEHSGDSHRGDWPLDCWQCGQDVAKKLRELHVGVEDSTRQQKSNLLKDKQSVVPRSLQYKDVFVLTRSELRWLSGFKSGLESPVTVHGNTYDCIPIHIDCTKPWTEDRSFQEDIIASEKVVMANVSAVRGLERKIVVVLAGRHDKYDEGKSAEELEKKDRLWAASRCSSQLIMVTVPKE